MIDGLILCGIIAAVFILTRRLCRWLELRQHHDHVHVAMPFVGNRSDQAGEIE
ncbi:hypothetical protein BH11ACT6_BH11ACT6_34500 [soil metagenome]